MSKESSFDYLIVGLGLSGTCLAQTLKEEYGKSVFVIDNDGGQKCSRVAIGTFNPVVFKTFSHTWKAPELIPFLNKFYSGMDEELLTPRAVIKTFKSEDQRKLWKEKSNTDPSAQFLDGALVDSVDGVKSDFGFGKVKQSGNLNMSAFLDGFRADLKGEGSLREEEFDYNKLQLLDDGISYGYVKASKVIFCEGHEARYNPWFKYLPFRETKGEILIIRVKGWNPGGIVHNKINIVPMGEDYYWVGSTFDREDKSLETTEFSRRKLVEQIEETIDVPYEIIEQKAGIRPTVKDRRPILGKHPNENNLYIFNGMGTRGVMLAPYFAKEMAEFLENGISVDKEVDIGRFSESV